MSTHWEYRKRVLVHNGKHGRALFGAGTDEELHDASLRLLLELKEWGAYDDEAETRAEQILNEGDGKAAYEFLKERSDDDYEYEGITLETVR